jgi:aspartyl-tRNA(Asn)/glutamyl-tRNA(Gln) amidotransferase subunit B
MRFDVNVSVSATNELGTRTETKNLNSFRSVEKAVEYEIARQTEVLKSGGKVEQETRGWDDDKQATFSQRSKEDAHDYRYFPDPDLPPIVISRNTIDESKASMPSLPPQIREKFSSIGLEFRMAEGLLDTPEIAHCIEYVLEAHDQKTAKTVANWYGGEIARLLSSDKVTVAQAVESAPRLIDLVGMIDGGMLSSTAAKELIEPLLLSDTPTAKLAEEHNLLQVSDVAELEMIVQEILSNNQKAVEDIRAGEVKAIGFIVGQTMKASGGKANPSVVQGIITKILGV